MERIWPAVGRAAGASSSASRPLNQRSPPWLQLTRRSNRSSSRAHSTHGVAHASEPSFWCLHTVMSGPTLRRTHVTTWWFLSPRLRASCTQVASRRRSAQHRCVETMGSANPLL
uniref:Uncharacterized protein n=1 Tax=Chlamydomonas leiostraca TaxID=1034604 RepID=A0A7S0WTZ4_9CHLO